ncbi:cellulase family glycosylhydrolase [bacterium]|nr:cellulase family glycosylhydrolase [bacterium]
MKATKLLGLILAALLLTTGDAIGVKQARPIRLHPKNPHYFLFRGKPTVLITSGEHYGVVLNLDFDYVKYLDELQSHGLNLTRTFSGMYVEEWGPGWNTLNPAPNRYVCPWAGSSQRGYADEGNKFDLDKWNPNYFKRLRDFVSQAGQRGIVVELVLFCVFYGEAQWNLSPLNSRNNINGVGKKGRLGVYDESEPAMMRIQEKMVRKTVRELKGFDNVYFELCNEPYFANGPKLGSPWNDRIISAIRSVTKGHLVALNVANGSVKVDKMHPGVSIFNFHYCRPPDAVAMNYHHNTPIAFDESGFKGTGAANYRKYGWDFIIAGGAVFSNLDWSFTVDSEEGKSKAAADRLGPKDPALRPQLGYLKKVMDSLDFVRMKPRNDVIKGGVPPGATARVLAEHGKAYAIYISGGNKADLKLDIPPGGYTAEWLNTKTGKTESSQKLRHGGGVATLSSPDYSEDIALRIKAIRRGR